jgi:hypothetical protein
MGMSFSYGSPKDKQEMTALPCASRFLVVLADDAMGPLPPARQERAESRAGALRHGTDRVISAARGFRYAG